MPKGYDSRCEDLARLFLGDEPALLTDENARELAQDIQDTIENFMSSNPSCTHCECHNTDGGACCWCADKIECWQDEPDAQ